MSKTLNELNDLVTEMRHTRSRNDCPHCQGNKYGGLKPSVHERWTNTLDRLHNEIKSLIALKDAHIAELDALAEPAKVAAELTKKRK